MTECVVTLDSPSEMQSALFAAPLGTCSFSLINVPGAHYVQDTFTSYRIPGQLARSQYFVCVCVVTGAVGTQEEALFGLLRNG